MGDPVALSCKALGGHMTKPGNPFPLLGWCPYIGSIDPNKYHWACRVAVWSFYWSIINAIISCIVIAIWIDSLGVSGIGWGSYYASFIWPVAIAFLWMFIAVFLVETKNQTGLIIYAIIQGIWTVYLVYGAISYLQVIAVFASFGYDGGAIWVVPFVLEVVGVAFSMAVTFWIYKAHRVVVVGSGEGGQAKPEHHEKNEHHETHEQQPQQQHAAPVATNDEQQQTA